jgi:hypothetical protein
MRYSGQINSVIKQIVTVFMARESGLEPEITGSEFLDNIEEFSGNYGNNVMKTILS